MENRELFERFADLTLEWNEKINVTAIRDREEFLNKNVYDSLLLCGHPEIEKASRVLDMGTGGGLPGVPLAIAYPDKDFLLVDSVGKKLKVVEAVCAELGLKNVKVLHARAEELARKPEYREQFDLVVSRAVANMSSLSEYCLPFVKIGGNFVAYKTETSAEEIEQASNAIKKLGGSPVRLVRPDNAEGELSGHLFAVVEKSVETSSLFPRAGGQPLKKPL